MHRTQAETSVVCAHKIWILDSYTFCFVFGRAFLLLLLLFSFFISVCIFCACACVRVCVCVCTYTYSIHRALSQSSGCVRLKTPKSTTYIHALIVVSSHWCLREISVGRRHSKGPFWIRYVITAFSADNAHRAHTAHASSCWLHCTALR